MSRSLSLIPRYDPALVELMPTAARVDFNYWRPHLEPILKSSKPVNPALRRIAAQTGQPFKTVRNRYYRGRQHGLLGIVDRRLCGPDWWRSNTPRKTCPVSKCRGLQELWKKLCEENARKSKPEYQRLVSMWKKRDPQIAAIPEYADFPGWPRLPEGWTYDNLMKYGPTDFELAAARRGRNAAKAHAPTVYTTRAGLYVGAAMMLDDKWNDLFVNTLAEKKHGRPLEVYSFDLFAAKKLRKAVRVRTKDMDGSYKGVAEVMTRFTFAATLYLDGFSPRGTTVYLEHGTAALSEAVREFVTEATRGKVTFELSGMTGDPAHIGQYPGLVRGNPRHKAHLESNNNLEHNAQAHLPGQTGRNVEERPEELAGRLDYNATLLAAYAELPPEKAALLEFPVLELGQYLDLASHIEASIANRRDHELEGWFEAGNIIQGYQWGDSVLLESQLTPEQRAVIPQMLEAGLINARPLRMTRQEVWDRGAGELQRVPGWMVCGILGDDLARESKIVDNEFAIRDQEIGPGIYRYEPIITTPEGGEELLRSGETYQVFINPFALGTLFVRDAAGRYLGEAKQIFTPCRGDHDAVMRAVGEAAARETKLLAPLRARHADKARERLARHKRNAAVVGSENRDQEDAARAKNETATSVMLSRESKIDDGA